MKTEKRWVVIAMVLALGIITIFTCGSKSEDTQSGTNQQNPPTVQGKALADQLSELFESAAEKVNPAVVPIFSEETVTVSNSNYPDDMLREFFGDDFFKQYFGNVPQGKQKQTVHGLGSGVIVSQDGYILTNNHVVQGAQKLTVIVADKKKYTGKIIGTDPQTDVALIKIDAKDLPVANLGNSDNVKVGQWVIAIGNPFQLMHTVTAGIISAKGRSSVGLADYEDFIQTDASINPGNSGGALADLDGNVIGINTAIVNAGGQEANVGVGFAIPINMAKQVMEELKSKGKITRGYLGINLQDIDDNLAKALKLKTTEGALVGDVNSGGPADKAGIKRGDIIIKLNGAKVTNSTELKNMVAMADPGSSAKVTLLRDGQEMDITVKLGERPRDLRAKAQEQETPKEETSKKLGLTIQNLTPDIAKQLNYDNEHGVIISDVEGDSPADDAGLQRGDLIKEINGKTIANVKDFDSALKSAKSGESLAFLIRRGQYTFYQAIQVP